MAINDDENILLPGEERVKLPNVDYPVRQYDSYTPNGRDYKSTTFTTVTPDRPKIFSTARARRHGYETMISVNVEPTEMEMPDMDASSPYEESHQFFNRTSQAIKVTNKHNVTWTLPKPKFWNQNSTEYFVVRKRIRINNADVATSILFNHQVDGRYLTVDDGEREQILELLEDKYKIGALRGNNFCLEITIDRILPTSLFHNFSSIYVSDLDLLFRLDNTDIGTPHPTSQDAVIRGEILDKVGDRRITGTLYEIIDNVNAFTSRYICLGKKVMQIPIHKDESRAPGIYHTEIDNVNIDRLHISMNRTELSDAETLGIYKTREEAATKGHVTESFKLELARMEREAAADRHEIETLKANRQEMMDELQHSRKLLEIRLDLEKTAVNHARDRLTTEASVQEVMLKKDSREHQDELERQALERKAHYEERSLQRKDSSELLKWAPTLVTATAALATAVVVALNRNEKENRRAVSASEIGFDFD